MGIGSRLRYDAWHLDSSGRRRWGRRSTICSGKKTTPGWAISRIYPDYWTQGDSLDDLIDHLKDLYLDLSGGKIAGARKLAALVIP